MWKQFRKQYHLQMMTLPWIVWIIVFAYLPMYGIVLAFKEFQIGKGIWGSPWVGMGQFEMFFQNPDIWNIIRNTVAINVLRLLFAFPAPIVLALLINELSGRRFKRFVQTISYLPHFMSWVIGAGVVFSVLSLQDGLLNRLLVGLGLLQEPVMFLGEPNYFWAIIVASGIWKEVGFGTIIYLAAIAGIDQQMYEAAVVDGANRFQRVMKITVPSIAPTIVIMLIFTMAGLFTAGFDQLYLLANPLVLEVGEVLDTYVYKSGISSGRYSYATAVGLFMSAIGFLLVLAANFAAKRLSGTRIW